MSVSQISLRSIPTFDSMQNTLIVSDSERVAIIKQIFLMEETENVRSYIASDLPSASDINDALNLFKDIQDLAAKRDLFTAVICSDNITNDIAQKFYCALPSDMQNQLKFQIYDPNTRNEEGDGLIQYSMRRHQGELCISDSERVAIIKQIFRTEGTEDAGSTIASATLSALDVNDALNLFRHIQDPTAKMDAFAAVLWADNATNDIAKHFYSALPRDMQDRLK